MRWLALIGFFIICFSYTSGQRCQRIPGCSRLFCRFFPSVKLKCRNSCISACRGGTGSTPPVTTTPTTTTPAPTPGPWSACTRTCGGGTRTRTRACRSRNPNNCGRQSQPCNAQACPPVFNTWTTCSRSCDTGTRFRVRRCPGNNINTCPRQFQDCNTGPCPNVQCRRPDMFRYNTTSECCRRDNHPCGTNARLASRIIGGTPTTLDMWPWMVRLEIVHEGEGSVCSAVLINLEYAVTAGHCIEPFALSEITAFVAFSTTRQAVVPLRSAVVHPQYNFPENDIAVIRFQRPVSSGQFVRPICLPRGEETAEDKKCFIAGWGSIDRTSGVTTLTLQEARLRILPFRSCTEAYRNDPLVQRLSPTIQLCAGTLTGAVDSCNGDSGGPLMCQRCNSCSWYMAGTVSLGPQVCGTPNEPGIYTRMTTFEDWIQGIAGTTQTQTFTCN